MRIPVSNIIIALVALLLAVGCAQKSPMPGYAKGPSSVRKNAENVENRDREDEAREREEDLERQEEDDRLALILDDLFVAQRHDAEALGNPGDFGNPGILNPAVGFDPNDPRFTGQPRPNANLAQPISMGGQRPGQRLLSRIRNGGFQRSRGRVVRRPASSPVQTHR